MKHGRKNHYLSKEDNLLITTNGLAQRNLTKFSEKYFCFGLRLVCPLVLDKMFISLVFKIDSLGKNLIIFKMPQKIGPIIMYDHQSNIVQY